MMKFFCNNQKINSGGQADIYKGNILSTEEQVVLKIYKTKKGQICSKEFNILSLLQNYPYIVELAGLDSLPIAILKDTLLVVKYYQNHCLFDYIKKSKYLQENISKLYLSQYLSALSSAHREGIFHLDVKPENIFIDDNFDVKLGDWGLSEKKDDIYEDDLILHIEKGSKSYMSPQMFRSSKYKMNYNACKADVWSAGVTYFVMLFGKVPFGETGPFDCNYYFNHFCRNGSDGKRIFWNHHNIEKSGIIISQETKDFFDYIFIEDENKRPTIDEILHHSYLSNDTTRSFESEKIEIMKSLKNRIDEELDNIIVIEEDYKVINTNNSYKTHSKLEIDN